MYLLYFIPWGPVPVTALYLFLRVEKPVAKFDMVSNECLHKAFLIPC